MANYVLTSLRLPSCALSWVFCVLNCALRYTVPCVTREYPASCPYLYCEFPYAFAYLLQHRFSLAFNHLFPSAWFACVSSISLTLRVSPYTTSYVPSAYISEHLKYCRFSKIFLVRCSVHSMPESCKSSRFPVCFWCIPQVFPRVFGSSSLTLSNGVCALSRNKI